VALINFREIGGLILPSGKILKKHVLFRSGDLSFLEYQEAENLLERTRVHAHIDLRVKSEINIHKPNYFFNLVGKLHNLAIDTQDEQFSRILLPNVCEWADFYIRILKRNSSQIVSFLKIISDGVNKPVSFGCSAGKDRTGIISAILLSLLEVRDEQIIEDYCLSNAGLSNHVHYFEDTKKELGRTREEFLKTFLIVSEETMRLFLRHLEVQEGGIVRMLVRAGLEISLVEQLKSNLSE
jgi:protein-tyrosine phosphatase